MCTKVGWLIPALVDIHSQHCPRSLPNSDSSIPAFLKNNISLNLRPFLGAGSDPALALPVSIFIATRHSDGLKMEHKTQVRSMILNSVAVAFYLATVEKKILFLLGEAELVGYRQRGEDGCFASTKGRFN